MVAGLRCHADSTLAIAPWCRDQHLVRKRLVGPRRFLCPSGSWSRKRLPRLHAEQIECTLADWTCRTLVASPDDPMALDGQTVRGARTDEQAAPHLLSFRTHSRHDTLFPVAVSETTHEIPVAQALVPCLPLTGRVCTADALHTHRAFLPVVARLGGKSVRNVKRKQPILSADLATSFADPQATLLQDATPDFQRGRSENRSIRVRTDMNTDVSDWPCVAHVAALTRTVTVRKTGHTSQEVVSLIPSLTPAEASPQRFLALVRGHGRMENSSHSVRAVPFGEDRSRLRTGSAPGDPGCAAPCGHHPHPSVGLLSDRCDQVPCGLSPVQGF